MSADSQLLTSSAVTAQLRAAGCVYAEDEALLLVGQARTQSELAHLLRRRVAGEPLEQVLGWAQFCGLRIAVGPGVFVPRRRTEFLVSVAASAISASAVVVDICCGSGAIGVAIAAATTGRLTLYATDIDPAAVRCAAANLAAVDGTALVGDLAEPLPTDLAGQVDLMVASTPYVPTDSIELLPSEARDHEPRVALDGGGDGLAVVRRLASVAPHWLRINGILLIETSRRQAASATSIFESAGLKASVETSEEWEATVVIGRNLAP